MTVKSGLEKRSHRGGAAAARKALERLANQRVLVGIPADKAVPRKPEAGEPAPPTNAQIGYWMEHGVPAANIPARPHLRPGVRQAWPTLRGYLERAGQEALRGDEPQAMKLLNAAGLAAQAAVQAKVTSGPFAPLAPATIAKRRAKGHMGSKPLIETGAYRQALTYVIRKLQAFL